MMDSKLPQSNTQIKRQAIIANQGQRNFGGKTSEFEDNRERHFYQRMLKAYLKGHAYFQFGKSWKPNEFKITELLPDWYNVQLTDKTVDAKALDKLLANGYTDPGKVFGGVKLSNKQLKAIIDKRLGY